MATPIIAAGAIAFGLYVYARQWQQCGFRGASDVQLPARTHLLTEQPPTTWLETLYLFKEALRYVYQETFARWSALDLFFGLAVLARREPAGYPAADIAASGAPLVPPSREAALQLLQELRKVRRYMLYCQGLRHRSAELQRRHWADHLGTEPAHILAHSPAAGLLRPAYAIVADPVCSEVLLVVRGTNSQADMFTSLTGAVKPHHVVNEAGGAVLGYSHLGMLAAARWLMGETKQQLLEAQAVHPGYSVRLVGHSMGGGTAALLTMMLREKVPQFSSVTCWSIACPACATLALSHGCSAAVTSLLHGTDIVPTFSLGTVDALREQVVRSSWFADFQSSVRQQLAGSLRTLGGGRQWRLLQRQQADGLGRAASSKSRLSDPGGSSGVGGAWGAGAVLSSLAASLTACYQRRPRASRRNSSMGGAGRGPGAGLIPRGLGGMGLGPRGTSRQSLQPEDELQGLLPSSQFGGAAGGSSGGAAAGADPAGAILERALEHALEGVTSGFLGPGPGPGSPLLPPGVQHPFARPGSAVMVRASAPLPVSTPSSSSSGGSKRVAVAAAYEEPGGGPGAFVAAASRAVLGTNRPVAAGKKNDDESDPTAEAPTGSSSSGAPAGARRGAITPSANSSSSSSATHVAPTSSSRAEVVSPPPGGSVSPAPGGVGGPSPTADEEQDPRAAAATGSSLGQVPSGLRRRGWGPWDLLGGSGWVQEPLGGASSSSSAAGGGAGMGRAVVAALGQTVNSTGRLVAATTGQLLRGPGLMFQACAVQGVQEQQQQRLAWRRSSTDSCEGGRPDAAPWSPLMRKSNGKRSGGGSFWDAAAAGAGVGRGAGQGPHPAAAMSRHPPGTLAAADGSDGDPDLLEEEEVEGSEDELEDSSNDVEDSDVDPDLGGAGALGDPDAELDAAAVTASIGAVVAAVTSTELAHERPSPGMGAAAGGLEQGRGGSSSNLGAAAAVGGGGGGGSPFASHASNSGSSSCGSPFRAPPSPAAAGGRASSSSSAAASYYSKKMQHKANRQMYPVGRLLHLMPVGARLQGQDHTPEAATGSSSSTGAGGGGQGVSGDAARGSMGGRGQPQHRHSSSGSRRRSMQEPRAPAPPHAAYELLEVPNPEVYGRVVLCRSMVRDHFIPSYLRALDSVMEQLEDAAAAADADASAEGV